MAVDVNGDGESFQEGIPKELFEARLTLGTPRSHFVVTSEGKRFLVNAVEEGRAGASFTVVLNWPTLLKR